MEKSEENLLKDAKRLLAVNATEQKRLEKFHKYIDRKKKEKEKFISRAQRDAILKFYESSGKGFEGISHTEKIQRVKGLNCLRAVVSSDAVLQNPEAKPCQRSDNKRQNKKLSLQERSSKVMLPELDFAHFLTRKNKPFRRTRSWSSPTLVCRLEDLGSRESRKEQKGPLFDKRKGRSPSVCCVEKNSIQEKCKDNEVEQEKPKKPLSAILPPLVLPPLHSQRRPSLKEQNKNMYKNDNTSDDKNYKKQCEELSDCRYLRMYHP